MYRGDGERDREENRLKRKIAAKGLERTKEGSFSGGGESPGIRKKRESLPGIGEH